MRKNNFILVIAGGLIFFIMGGLATVFFLQEKYGSVRSATTALTQTINAGTLTVDIVDAAYAPVSNPSMGMGTTAFSFSCNTATGALGTATQQLYVKNPDAADNGWTMSIAASAPTAVWDSAGKDYDFNDPTTSGCTDGGDTDTLGGQLTLDASVATLAKGACSACGVTGISKGTSSAFNEGTVDSITLLSAASGSDDIGDWTLQGVSLSQQIPAEQPAATDYTISFTLTVVAI